MRTLRERRRGRLVGTLAGGTVAIALLIGAGSGTATPAYAIDLPTWDDVQEAKRNEQAAAEKVAEIEGLLEELEGQLERTRNAAEEAASAFLEADRSFQDAVARTSSLEAQARQSRETADEAAQHAGALVSLMYRSGGIDRNIDLFLEEDASTADALLDRLAATSKVTERNTQIADEAAQAMNTAESLRKQADEAREERDKLRQIAEEEKAAAAAEAEAARRELVEQEEQKQELSTQLEALKDTSAKTVDGYEERLRQEEERRRQAEEAARSGNGGGGGGRGGAPAPPPPDAGPGGWTVPLADYYVSDEWGAARNHTGIDLAAGSGAPIRAAGPGTVTFSGWWPYCGGYQVEITHPGGLQTWYSHQNGPPVVANGQQVNGGEVIGYVGATGCVTGPHLHFSTLQDGQFVPPRPPMAERGVNF